MDEKRSAARPGVSGHLSFQDDGEFRHQFLESPKRHVGLEDIDLPDELDPGQEFDSRKRLDTIFKAVSEMPEKRREVFILSRLHGMNHKEIAEKLNVSAKTVENHINFALRELRKIKYIIVFFISMVFS